MADEDDGRVVLRRKEEEEEDECEMKKERKKRAQHNIKIMPIPHSCSFLSIPLFFSFTEEG